MEIDVMECDLSELDGFALVFLVQTFLADREVNPSFVNPVIEALLTAVSQWTAAVRRGCRAPVPMQTITFDLSRTEANRGIATLELVERKLRSPKEALFRRSAPGTAWIGPAAEFVGVVRTGIQQAMKEQSAAPAESKKSSATNSGVN